MFQYYSNIYGRGRDNSVFTKNELAQICTLEINVKLLHKSERAYTYGSCLSRFHWEAADEAETLKHIQVNYHRLVLIELINQFTEYDSR